MNKREFADPMVHYVEHGFAEGRLGFARTRDYLSFTLGPERMHEALALLCPPDEPGSEH